MHHFYFGICKKRNTLLLEENGCVIAGRIRNGSDKWIELPSENRAMYTYSVCYQFKDGGNNMFKDCEQ